MTFNRLCKRPRLKKTKKLSTPLLNGNPQRKVRLTVVTKSPPKKPNSANRAIAKGFMNNNIYEKRNKTKRNKTHPLNRFKKNTQTIIVYLPGEGQKPQEHNVILIQGGGAQDTPGCSRYSAVPGAIDFSGVENRRNGRSRYGVKKQ